MFTNLQTVAERIILDHSPPLPCEAAPLSENELYITRPLDHSDGQFLAR